MRTKAIAILLSSLCFGALLGKAVAKDASTVSQEVKKAVSDSLHVYKVGGASGLTKAVSDCWNQPRDFCLYLDFASHHIAMGATYIGVALDEYFHEAAVVQRGHAWLSRNGRRYLSNDQYLDAVDEVMVRTLITHRDKMFKGVP